MDDNEPYPRAFTPGYSCVTIDPWQETRAIHNQLFRASINGIMLWDLITSLPYEAKLIFRPDFEQEPHDRRRISPLLSILLFISKILVIPTLLVCYKDLLEALLFGGQSWRDELYFDLPPAYYPLHYIITVCDTAVYLQRALSVQKYRRSTTSIIWILFAISSVAHVVKFISREYKSYSSTIRHFKSTTMSFDTIVMAVHFLPQFREHIWKESSIKINGSCFEVRAHFNDTFLISSIELTIVLTIDKILMSIM